MRVLWSMDFVGYHSERDSSLSSPPSMAMHLVSISSPLSPQTSNPHFVSREVFMLGGGMEMVVNWYALGNEHLRGDRDNGSDLVIASERASFALPEVKRGVFAKAGALGRIIRFIGTSPFLIPTPHFLLVCVTISFTIFRFFCPILVPLSRRQSFCISHLASVPVYIFFV